CSPGSLPVRAVISAASRLGTIPSLSVVHTVPSHRRNVAPELSSPQNPTLPSMSPSTNHLNPTGTSMSRRLKPSATRSIMPLLTMVFPTATLLDHCERLGNRYDIATER